MKRIISVLRLLTAISAAFGLCTVAPAQIVVWTNSPSNTTTNWSDALNWQGNIVPGAGNTAFFDNNPGMAPSEGTNYVDNIVNQNFLVSGLTYAETNGFHNTLINPGLTLTVSNNTATALVLSGTETDAGSSGNLYNTISGDRGTFVLVNTNTASSVIIRQGSSASPSPMSTVDMSALDNFDLTVGQIQVAVKGPIDHAGGTLILAKTNLIQATTEVTTGTTGPSGAIEIYDSSANTGSAEQSKGIMQLGVTNGIYADVITVGRSKSPSGTLLSFNPNFASYNPTAYFRGYNSNRVTKFLVADDTGISSSANCIAAADLSGGTSDLMVNTMVVGNGQTGTSTGPITATFTMGAGNLNVNNLYVGYQNSTGAAETMTCAFDLVNGGNVVVNSNLFLGHYLGGSKHSTPTLNISNGTLTATNGIFDLTSNSSSAVSLDASTVTTPNIGTTSGAIGNMGISDSTLNLAVTSLSGEIFTSNLLTESESNGNVINITSIAPALLSSSVITLIQSGTQIQNLTGINGQLDFVLGTLPDGLTGSIQSGDNGMAVQLVLTKTVAVTNTWTGADIAAHNNTNWSDGPNWSTGAEPNSSGTAQFATSGSVGGSALSNPGGGEGAIVPGKINNIVDGNVTIASLIYDNTNGTFQNTFVDNGDTLSVGLGGLTVGSGSSDFGDSTGSVTITGAGGALNVNSAGAQIYVGLGDASTSSSAKATLDMSGLGAFNANVLNFLVGVGGYSSGPTTVLQPVGTVYLAQTNNITTSSSVNDASDFIPVALEVGDAGDSETAAGYGNTSGSVLYLGLTNSISADYIDVGRQWASGGIFFNPAVTNENPTVSIGGASGSAVTRWNIGDGAQNALIYGGGSGTNDFTGGTVNALVNTLQIGVGSSASSSVYPESGTLTFNAGTITANTVNLSYSAAFLDGYYYSFGVGTVNVNGTGALVVTGNLSLGALSSGDTSGAVVGSPTGTLNISGGAVLANIIQASPIGATSPGAAGGATSVINMNGGVLAATNGIGTAAAPLTSLNLTNATIYVGGPSEVFIFADNVTADGSSRTTNLLDILTLPPIERYPATVTVVKSATPIALVGGAFNFQVNLPSVGGGTPYTGSLSESGDSMSILLTLTSGPIGSRGTVYWNGPDGSNLNWSDANNWLLPGTPGPTDTAFFNNIGVSSSAGAGSVDNIVDENVVIAGLIYAETNGFHNTVINSGETLMVSNDAATTLLLSGTETDAGDTVSLYNTVSGTGSLVVYDTNKASTAVITQGSASTSHSPMSTLDLSGLNNFDLTVGQLQIAVYGAQNDDVDHPGGTLILAATNIIQVTTEAVTNVGGASGAIEIYDGSFNLDSAVQSKGIMELGLSNAIYADAITVGRSKSPSGTELIFNPDFAANNPSAYFRGYNSNRVTQFLVADDSPVSSGVACVGLVDLSEGASDLMINTLVVGNGQTGTGAGPITATFDMGAGNLNVNDLYIGYQNSTTGAEPMTCALNVVNGGNVVVNSNLLLGNHLGGTVYPSAALNITGGTLAAPNISDQSGNASGTVTLANSTVSLTSAAGSIGAAAHPIGSINLNDTTLNLAVGGMAAPVVTSTLTISGTTDTINVTTLPPIVQVPATNTLIQSIAPMSGTYDFVLGSLPANYTGHIQESADNTTVQLVITAAPAPSTIGTTITAVSVQKGAGTLVFSGTNGVASTTYYVLTSTNLALPLADWTAIVTNTFDGSGNFSVTVPYSSTNSADFYLLKSQ
ncbi:MAG TPA: hypothetical protein VH595_14855 [Verrucomicrobiae bacterium]|jgi:hypothetical protein|nr:hypothetical protein [Verrucomicrobiae bacterium]